MNSFFSFLFFLTSFVEAATPSAYVVGGGAQASKQANSLTEREKQKYFESSFPYEKEFIDDPTLTKGWNNIRREKDFTIYVPTEKKIILLKKEIAFLEGKLSSPKKIAKNLPPEDQIKLREEKVQIKKKLSELHKILSGHDKFENCKIGYLDVMSKEMMTTLSSYKPIAFVMSDVEKPFLLQAPQDDKKKHFNHNFYVAIPTPPNLKECERMTEQVILFSSYKKYKREQSDLMKMAIKYAKELKEVIDFSQGLKVSEWARSLTKDSILNPCVISIDTPTITAQNQQPTDLFLSQKISGGTVKISKDASRFFISLTCKETGEELIKSIDDPSGVKTIINFDLFTENEKEALSKDLQTKIDAIPTNEDHLITQRKINILLMTPLQKRCPSFKPEDLLDVLERERKDRIEKFDRCQKEIEGDEEYACLVVDGEIRPVPPEKGCHFNRIEYGFIDKQICANGKSRSLDESGFKSPQESPSITENILEDPGLTDDPVSDQDPWD
jgi:hypothetical protein